MCSIVGITSTDAELTSDLMKEFLIQGQIRGKHATGVAYLKNNKVEALKQAVPAEEFTQRDFFPKSKTMIGHTRYSTSDIHYNQPISNQKIAIVHNGVITQENPENWEQHFDFTDFETKNDTELLLKCLAQNANPFLEFVNASIACGVLTDKGEMYCMRNNTRPLWLFKSEYFQGFCSTSDMILRVIKKLDIEVDIIATKPFHKYIFMKQDIRVDKINHNKEVLFSKDQQIIA